MAAEVRTKHILQGGFTPEGNLLKEELKSLAQSCFITVPSLVVLVLPEYKKCTNFSPSSTKREKKKKKSAYLWIHREFGGAPNNGALCAPLITQTLKKECGKECTKYVITVSQDNSIINTSPKIACTALQFN